METIERTESIFPSEPIKKENNHSQHLWVNGFSFTRHAEYCKYGKGVGTSTVPIGSVVWKVKNMCGCILKVKVFVSIQNLIFNGAFDRQVMRLEDTSISFSDS